jgi:hypothetical protein
MIRVVAAARGVFATVSCPRRSVFEQMLRKMMMMMLLLLQHKASSSAHDLERCISRRCTMTARMKKDACQVGRRRQRKSGKNSNESSFVEEIIVRDEIQGKKRCFFEEGARFLSGRLPKLKSCSVFFASKSFHRFLPQTSRLNTANQAAHSEKDKK